MKQAILYVLIILAIMVLSLFLKRPQCMDIGGNYVCSEGTADR